MFTQTKTVNSNRESATSVLGFKVDVNSRIGLSSFALAVKRQLIEGVDNFSMQSTFHV